MTQSLHFRKSGNGKAIMVLFHGFGQDHKAFDKLTPILEEKYTVYAFDLYYHGRSHRPDKPLTLTNWREAFGEFLNKEGIENFSILGFSLGGRFALATVVGFHNCINEVSLVAPDGIYKNFWYLFATSFLGNRLFKYLMLNPRHFEQWIKIFSKYRLASPSMIRFAQKELQNHENCLKVYRTWTYFRPLQQPAKKLTKIFNQKNIPLNLFLGSKDYIIPTKKVVPKLEGIRTLKVMILPLKHHHLIEGIKDLIASSENAKKL